MKVCVLFFIYWVQQLQQIGVRVWRTVRKKDLNRFKNYLLVSLEVILEVKSIEFFIFLSLRIQVKIGFALDIPRKSGPSIIPLGPNTYSREGILRPASLAIIHDSYPCLTCFLTCGWKVEPVGIATSIHIIMQQQTVNSFVVGSQAQVAALKPRIELQVAAKRDERGSLIDVEDEVVLAEGLQLVDWEDVEGKRGRVAIKIEAVIYYVFLLKVSHYCGPQRHKFSSCPLVAVLIAKRRDVVGEASWRRRRTQLIGIQAFDNLFCGFDYFVRLGKDMLDLQIELILG